MTTATLTTADQLDLAADLIEERGWARGTGWNGDREDGKLCLEGGIMAALGISFADDREENDHLLGELQTCPAYKAVKEYADIPGSLWSWNDSQSSSIRVISTLRETARGLRRKQENA